MKNNFSFGVAVVALVISLVAVTSAFVVTPELTVHDGSIDTGKLAYGAVTSEKIVDGTVGDDDLVAGGISKIMIGCITADHLSAAVVELISGLGEIANNSITGAKIMDGSIDSVDIADDAVTSTQILDGAIGGSDLASNAVTAGKIASEAVGTDELADDSVTAEKLADDAVSWDSVVDKPLNVVAAGIVDSDGSLVEGYNVESVTWESTAIRYDIEITDVEYHILDYITVVSPIKSLPRFVTTSSVAGTLLVYIYDDAGNKVQDRFYFVTYSIT